MALHMLIEFVHKLIPNKRRKKRYPLLAMGFNERRPAQLSLVQDMRNNTMAAHGVNLKIMNTFGMNPRLKLISDGHLPFGGFVSYEWNSPGQKISYAQPLNAWGRLISSGIYLGEIDAVFALKTDPLQHRPAHWTSSVLTTRATGGNSPCRANPTKEPPSKSHCREHRTLETCEKEIQRINRL